MFLWDVWSLGQIVYSKIEYPSIINKIGFFNRSSVVLKFEFPCKNDNEDYFNVCKGQHCTEAVARQFISFFNSFVLRISFTFFFSDPDTIIAPRLPNDSVSERGPSPKAFSCRKASNTPDIDFDYGSAIGKSPEECTAYIQ